jgi:hypothetical protein|tara:strand:+ start:2835 stop:3086 length:252 start_codon:yes stop_codon:yes gene_type:complete
MIKNLKVKHLRMWETSRGWLGYEAKTKEGSIWNDGMGGPTYFEPLYPKHSKKDFVDFSECDLEAFIREFEEKKDFDNICTKGC